MKTFCFVIFLFIVSAACTYNDVSYTDATHYSTVFGHEKTYRIYLPAEYEQSEKQYPVVYYFHGWGGRHNIGGRSNIDYDALAGFANKYQTIFVLWDGRIEDDEPRPYNVGNHNDVKYTVQMKDYFIELLEHIDETYRTIPNRENRGIVGFSMGGFMSFYLAGKFHDKVSAAVNIVGSQEFFIGYPDNHTLYPLAYTFDNLRDVKLMFLNRTQCPMSGLNDELNTAAIWYGQQYYEYHKTEGEHNIDNPGETKVFESAVNFVASSFKNPVSLKPNWSYVDIYADFDVRGYSVKSNKNEPGFISLKNVSKNGFGIYAQKCLPNGPGLKNCRITISTDSIYKPGSVYNVKVLNIETNALEHKTKIADKNGKLHFEIHGSAYEIGISEQTDLPNFSVTAYRLAQNKKYLSVNKQDELSIEIFNRGGNVEPGDEVFLKLSCPDGSLYIKSPGQEICLMPNQTKFTSLPFEVNCKKTPPNDGSPAWLRLPVEIEYGSQKFTDVLLVPVFFDVPEFDNINVDDGINLLVGYNDAVFNAFSDDVVYTSGNADGRISAGETIMLFNGKHPLRLYCDDPYVLSDEEILVDMILKGEWPDGFTKSSVVKIADNCPPDHEIEFLAHYETKTFMPMYRKLDWGKVNIKVR
ncbi:MAG: hypothetical protein K9H26_05385 [Prolixibacteraceae bacterium]|nr:hypothetical protein [Prolixibacteraceae bacterium]